MYNNFDSEAAAFLTAFIGMFIVIGIISLALLVLTIIAMWKMFEKAGEPGWAALIPFYNAYVLFKISWGNGWYFLLYVVPYIIYCFVYCAYYVRLMGGIMGGITSHGYYNSYDNSYMASLMSDTIAMLLVMGLLGMGMLAVYIIGCIKLAKVFGQGGGFACGIFFLPNIFICIIAFSKNIFYVGIPGKIAPYGISPIQPVNHNPYYQPNGYPPQGYQNPYSQPQGSPQWGYQNPYYQPNGNTQWGHQAPAPQQPNAQSTDSFNQQMTSPSSVSYCSVCGTRIENGDKVCPKCGKEL